MWGVKETIRNEKTSGAYGCPYPLGARV